MHFLLAQMGLFLVAAAVVWKAGIWLSDTTDILDDRLHLGEALGGLLLLAIATNLPEIAITMMAALHHDLSLATGNILGGIAIQTVVLVIIDRWGVRGDKPLTSRVRTLVPVLEATVTMAVLVIAIMGTQLPKTLILWRLTPQDIILLLLWLGGVHLIGRAKKELRWQVQDDGPGAEQMQQPSSEKREQQEKQKKASTGGTLALFIFAAVLTLTAGAMLEVTGDALAQHVHLTGALFGATFLAAATSLPEISTGLAAAKLGDYELAMSDIFGGNAFLPVLFLLATLVSGQSSLPQAGKSDIYLAGLGILLTTVYSAGLVLRPPKQVAGMGRDSLWVLIFYALGIAGLAALSRGGG